MAADCVLASCSTAADCASAFFDKEFNQLFSQVPVGGRDISALPANGGYHTCAILASGGVDCWGFNVYGQLGDGTTATAATPQAVVGLP